MKVTVKVEGNFKKTKQFLEYIGKVDEGKIKDLAQKGTDSLKRNTPVSTGETRDGWSHRVIFDKYTSTIEWFNNAHPESPVNVAKLIHFGHYTKNGGYVPPTNFITSSLRDVMRTKHRDVSKVVTIK